MTDVGREDDPELEAFVAHAEERGCVQESEVGTLAARLDLTDAEVVELRERLAVGGVDVRDDCGREAPAAVYASGDLAHYTVDTMAQFLAEAARCRLLTAAKEACGIRAMRLASGRYAGRRSVLVRADRRPDRDGLCFPICEKPHGG